MNEMLTSQFGPTSALADDQISRILLSLKSAFHATSDSSPGPSYEDSLKSLRLASDIEYADYIHLQLARGAKINTIRSCNFSDTLRIYKTTQPVTHLPETYGANGFNIMVMPGHSLISNTNSGSSYVFDWNNTTANSDINLPRDIASIMLARLWKPIPEHFSENCHHLEIDKLLKRGKKKPKAYAGLPYAIQPPQ
jgi:hypothetical protein